MRKIIFLFFVFSTFLPAYGQKKTVIGIYALGLRENPNFETPTLRPLLQSANAYYGSSISGEFSQPVFKSRYKWGLGFLATAVGFDVSFGKQTAYSEAVFSNGEKYEMNISTKEFEYEFNFFIPMGFAGRIGTFLGFCKNKGQMRIGYRYADGDLSYGTEKPLTGVYYYSSFPLSTGLKCMLGYKWVNFFFKAGYSGLLRKFIGRTVELKDMVGNGQSIYSNQWLRVYMPQDFNGQFNSVVTSSGINDNVQASLVGWKFQFGIAFLLAKFNTKE